MIAFSTQPYVTSINVSTGGIPKCPVGSVFVHEGGLAGDGHNHAKHYRPSQAVSLQDVETLEELNQQGYALVPGATGENINIRGLRVNDLPVGTRLIFSGGVQIEVTRARPPCYVLDSIDSRLKKDILGRCGVYAEVIRAGQLTTGESVQVRISSLTAAGSAMGAAAAACDALADTGKGTGNYILALGIIESVALFVMVFLLIQIGPLTQ